MVMLFKDIYPDRWFTWTLVFLFVIGIGLTAYLQWVNLQMDAENTLLYSLI